MMSPRPNLMPGTSPRSDTGRPASVSTSEPIASGVMRKPWIPMSSWPAARCAAAARLRTAPPMPDRCGPALGSQSSSPSVLTHVVAHAGDVLLLGRPVAGEEVLGQPHRAESEGLHRERTAVGDAGELQAAAAEVDDGAVGQRRRVDRGDVAVERLVARGEHLDVDAGLPLRRGRGNPAGWSRPGSRSSRPRGSARTDRRLARQKRANTDERLDAAVHRLVAQLARGAETLADPDRLVQLVGALPPAAGGVTEHDEPPRVGAEVDHRHLPGLGVQVPGRAGRSPAHVAIIEPGADSSPRSIPLCARRSTSSVENPKPRAARPRPVSGL